MNQALSYMLKKNYYKIAVIPGDGIGNEVMPEAIRILEKIGERYNISFDFDQKDWSCERYHKFGSMMPEDGLDVDNKRNYYCKDTPH